MKITPSELPQRNLPHAPGFFILILKSKTKKHSRPCGSQYSRIILWVTSRSALLGTNPSDALRHLSKLSSLNIPALLKFSFGVMHNNIRASQTKMSLHMMMSNSAAEETIYVCKSTNQAPYLSFQKTTKQIKTPSLPKQGLWRRGSHHTRSRQKKKKKIHAAFFFMPRLAQQPRWWHQLSPCSVLTLHYFFSHRAVNSHPLSLPRVAVKAG